MERSLVNIWGLLVSSPVYIVWIVGIVIAAARWTRHPRVSLLAICGLVVLLIQDSLWTLINPWLQMTVLRGGIRMTQLSLVLGVIGFVGSLIRALGWGLVLGALFSTRNTQLDAV